MRKRLVAMAGCGTIARRHLAALHSLTAQEHLQIHVADPSASARQLFAAACPAAVIHADFSRLLEAVPPSAGGFAIIATPTALHAEQTIAALSHGWHVLCEKPLAMDADQARSMLEAAVSTGCLLGDCSNRFLRHPATRLAERLLWSPGADRPHQITWIERRVRQRTGVEYQPESAWFLDHRLSGGGVLMDWGPYDVAVLHDLLRPVRAEVLAAWTARPRTGSDPVDRVDDVEQQVGAHLRYGLADGGCVDVTYERAACTHGQARTISEILTPSSSIRWGWRENLPEGDAVTVCRDVGGRPQETVHRCEAPNLPPAMVPVAEFLRAVGGDVSRSILGARAWFGLAVLRAIYRCAEDSERQTVDMPAIDPLPLPGARA